MQNTFADMTMNKTDISGFIQKIPPQSEMGNTRGKERRQMTGRGREDGGNG